MGFLDTIKSALSGQGGTDKFAYWVHVRCNRCGEPIKTRIDMRNDLSLLDDGGYVVHKTLVGNGLCFQRIDVKLTFGEARNLVDEQVVGGELITADEYDELLQERETGRQAGDAD